MKALLVIDMIVDFIDPSGALYIGPVAGELTSAVRDRLESYRVSGDTVIYICDRHLEEDREFEIFPPHSIDGTGGSDIVSELTPRNGERAIYKRRYSAFFGTDLDLTLREKKVSELELAGCVTNICVLYTAAEARMLNYQVTVYKKAVNGFDPEAHEFALQEMKKTLGVILK
ncbi:MAG: isochorismatase family cysteine hydrolase [Bacillota bacterium]|nr:cysteine hydrolase [Bacillota bacterium]MDW7729374.1 isochorismatase family cysteine hydrolase [Bacillota bacterium]